MQSSFSPNRKASEMEQAAGPRGGENTADNTPIGSHMKEDIEPSGVISAPRDSARSDFDTSNGETRKETQSPSSEIVDSGGWHDSDEKRVLISPSLSTQSEHEAKNHSEGDHHTQKEEQHREEEEEEEEVEDEKGREKLNQHRVEIAGRVLIPEIWGQEEQLKDWVDCSVFEASLVPGKICSAKAALAEDGRKADPRGLRIDNSC